VLKYKDKEPPSTVVFETLDWVHVNHHSSQDIELIMWCFDNTVRYIASQLERVGAVEIRPDAPKDSAQYGAWQLLIMQIELQAAWEAGVR